MDKSRSWNICQDIHGQSVMVPLKCVCLSNETLLVIPLDEEHKVVHFKRHLNECSQIEVVGQFLLAGWRIEVTKDYVSCDYQGSILESEVTMIFFGENHPGGSHCEMHAVSLHR